MHAAQPGKCRRSRVCDRPTWMGDDPSEPIGFLPHPTCRRDPRRAITHANGAAHASDCSPVSTATHISGATRMPASPIT
jgi:hypothetical protein